MFIIGLTLTFGAFAQGTEIEIEAAQHPYYEIIEWKGMGALLMSRDPNQVSKQVNLTLVGNQNTSIWDQKFMPKSEDFYYISSENARYVYFIDNLELQNGKVYFNQLNSAGNVKSTSADVGSAVKKLGYDFNNLDLINIVVTDKALTFHYRYEVKKNKSIMELAVFMTHHNFLCYAVELGEIPEVALKDENIGHWEYVGFTEDKICFAARDFKNKVKGWSIKEYTSKGKLISGYFINGPPEDLIMIENIGFGTTGKYYLKDKQTLEKGLLCYINSTFYLMGAKREGNSSAELILYELAGGDWEQLNTMQLNYFIEKKTLQMGIYPMNEGVGYHLDHNGYNKVSYIAFKKGVKAPHNDFSERTIFNPSSVFENKDKKEFKVLLPEVVVSFNTDQLNKPGPVKFVLTKR